MTPLDRFIATCCIFRPNGFVTRLDLHQAYSEWLRVQGQVPVAFDLFQAAVVRILKANGQVMSKLARDINGKERVGYVGVALRGAELRLDAEGVLRAA
jgi:hypothetical protein